MKRIIRIILKWVTAPFLIPIFLIIGHFLWLSEDDAQYSWIYELIIDYLLDRMDKYD